METACFSLILPGLLGAFVAILMLGFLSNTLSTTFGPTRHPTFICSSAARCFCPFLASFIFPMVAVHETVSNAARGLENSQISNYNHVEIKSSANIAICVLSICASLQSVRLQFTLHRLLFSNEQCSLRSGQDFHKSGRSVSDSFRLFQGLLRPKLQ